MCRKYFWGVFFILIAQPVVAQQKKLFTGNFTNTRFGQFVRTIEKETALFFYYDATSLDSLPVNLSINTGTLSQLLDSIFYKTRLTYSIDPFNRVFITTSAPIQTGFAPGFFDDAIRQQIPETSSWQLPDTSLVNKKNKSPAANSNKLYEIGNKNTVSAKAYLTLAGYVKDVINGEPIAGATVYIDTPAIATTTDAFGYYSISLPKGRQVLQVKNFGMKTASRQIVLYTDGNLSVEMEAAVASLRTVIVTAEKKSTIKTPQLGIDKLSIKTIKQIPAVLGEADVLRAALTLPGVTSVGEASTGLNVRGGAADQNLILFNDATIYNPSHLFGFFSAFNPDAVKGFELYKSSIPEKYGGRLSSVLDISAREGNKKKMSVLGGIGPLTSKITLEGPILKDKSSFIVSGRTTYSNWLLRNLKNAAYNKSRASFSDISLFINHYINNKNSLYVTGYFSNDEFKLNNDTLFRYGNRNLNIKWKHIVNNRFHAIFTAGADRYQYSVLSEANTVNAFKLKFSINQSHFRADFNFSPSNKHQLNFGVNTIYYKFRPGSFEPSGSQSLIVPTLLAPEQALETGFYVGDRIALTEKLSLNAGIRYSLFNYLGPRSVDNYLPGLPRDKQTVAGTTTYGPGDMIKTYGGPEYRLALRYLFTDDFSIKMGYNSTRQYIHMLSNTTAISPIDIWKLSDPNIAPQSGNQISLGLYRNLKAGTIETSFEVYYKKIKNYLDFKSGATLLVNPAIERETITTAGKAYGAELLIRKNSGKLNGSFSYTYSRILLKMDDPIAGEIINNGDYYPANYDKPHNLSLTGNYRFTHRVSMSLNTAYNTGRPITLPIGLFNLGGAQRVLYSDRNKYRIPDYWRTDISVTIEGNHKVKQLFHNSWSIGVYNLFGRKNAYSVYFTQENGLIKGYQLSIFGTAIPFITYNFRF